MAKELIIVESPTKANTIKKYLGRGYAVKASVGHIRDLPKKVLGVDVDNDFAPTYETIRGKKKVIDDIVKAAAGADVIYLAPDPDREGEAIAWHVAEAIRAQAGGVAKKTSKAKTKSKAKSKTKTKASDADGATNTGPAIHRVLFHEITKGAIQEALKTPQQLNPHLFEAQQARRILDRLVGYQVSPILWDKVRRGLSAGRVQTVALRIICERDAAIAVFVPTEYWSIIAHLEGSAKPAFESKLLEWNGEKTALGNEASATEVVAAVNAAPFTLSTIVKKERKRNPTPPFITSKLQQEAARKLGFTAKKTMMLAQRLYEGVELGEEGPVGLITYMRTDSVRVSATALEQVRELIGEKYGKAFMPSKPIEYKNKKKGVQDAHEAIRPTMLDHPPDTIEPLVEKDMFRLYDLIWKRFVASQMTPARYDQTTFDIDAAAGKAKFRASGSILKFEGFIQVYLEGEDDAAQPNEEENASLPNLQEGETLTCHGVDPHQHFTQPPPRFSEASLVKELEEQGIGRPSTYAAIMSNIQDKGYVAKDRGRFMATELGVLVNGLLVAHFPRVFDVGFTAKMETALDDVEEGARDWVATLREFYDPFAKTLAQAKIEMRDVKRQEIQTDHQCEKCGNALVIKWGRHGEFLACSAYPECKTTADFTRVDGNIVIVKEQESSVTCPECSAPMIVKRGRFGRFLACTKYPECKTTRGIPVGVKCPDDGGELVEKQSRKGRVFYSCENYPNCKFALWDKPVNKPCPQCNHPFILEKYTKKDGPHYRCSQKECDFTAQIDQSPE